jgi:fimbrial chaperone protein
MIKKNLICTGILLLIAFSSIDLFASTAPGQFAISPPFFELSLGNKPLNESIRVLNLKKEPLKIKVEVYNWTMDEKNIVKIIPGTEQSLDQWMLINPLSFTIEPQGTQIIRFSIRPRTKPEPGEHRAIIYLTEQASDTLKTESGGVKVLFRYGMSVYADTEPIKKSSTLTSFTFDKASSVLKADINNTGNVRTRFKGEYTIWKTGTFPGFNNMSNYIGKSKSEKKQPEGLLGSGVLNSAPVLPGQRRTIVTPVGIGDNKIVSYVLAVKGSLDDKPVEKLFP